jgi:hypothetical protein
MANEHETLFREVDEELRREQLMKIWNNYGTYIIGAVVVLLVGIGGYKLWQDRRASAISAAGSQFLAAIETVDNGQLEDAQKALGPVISSGVSGYAALARIKLAGAMARDGKIAEAAKAYDELAADSSADKILRDYARLQSAMLMVDTEGWTALQNRLTDLMADNNPWRFSAREVAGISALKAQKYEDARQVLGPLVSDPRVPPSTAERARAVMALVAEAELAKAAPVTADEPAAAPAPAVDGKAPPAKAAKGKK